MVVSFIANSIRYSVIYIFGITGTSINEKSGHLNMGIPGIVCLGVLGGILGAVLVGTGATEINPFVAFIVPTLLGILFAAIGGLVFSFFAVTLKCNQNVVGLVMTTFLTAFCNFFIKGFNMEQSGAVQRVAKAITNMIPGYKAAGWFGEIFLAQSVFLWIAIILAIVVSLVISRTRIGLNLRACGENPAAADAVGINVNLYRYVATIVSAVIVGIGGVSFVLDYSVGLFNIDNNYASFGWLILSLVIVSNWKPWIGVFVGIGLGMLSFIPFQIGIPTEFVGLIKIVPYAASILILIFTSIFNSKRVGAPSALGQTYFREDR